MPLLQITTSTNLGTNAALGFCLVSQEDTRSFTRALEQLKILLETENIPAPDVIISDFDKAFKNAASDVFPEARQMLCLWRIIKNVILNIKKKWNGRLEGTRLMASDGAGSMLRGPDAAGPAPADAAGPAPADAAGPAPADAAGPAPADAAGPAPVDAAGPDAEEERAGMIALEKMTTAESTAVPEDAARALAQYRGHTFVAGGQRRWEDSADGILAAWLCMCYADTETEFNAVWEQLRKEFSHQRGK